MVIDNELNIRKLVQVNLTASGYEVLTAADGETGLRLARGQNLALILLDLRMPAMSGWDFLRAIKADSKLNDIPIILITASVRTNQEAKALVEGAAGYMTKPFTVDELLSHVKKAIGG